MPTEDKFGLKAITYMGAEAHQYDMVVFKQKRTELMDEDLHKSCERLKCFGWMTAAPEQKMIDDLLQKMIKERMGTLLSDVRAITNAPTPNFSEGGASSSSGSAATAVVPKMFIPKSSKAKPTICKEGDGNRDKEKEALALLFKKQRKS